MSALRYISARLFGGDFVYARKTKGGIQPPGLKQHSLRSRIMATPIPERLSVPIGSELRGTVSPLVDVGEKVRKYQIIGKFEPLGIADSSFPVHAPTSGIISSIENAAVADHRDREQVCVMLDTDGEDNEVERAALADFSRLRPAEILAQIRDAGIIGQGGAGFPTAKKLSAGDADAIELLIINAAECEPYISADEALMRERAKPALLGTEVLRRASSAARCILAIEDSKLDAIAALKAALLEIDEDDCRCELTIVPSKYPAGSERQLIQTVCGIEIPSSEHPAESGILMQNIGSAHAAYQAVIEGKPCISRITTLCGEALRTPKNFEVLLGTSSDFLFELCGVDDSKHSRSIVGGALMGRDLGGESAAIGQTTNCLIAAGTEELYDGALEKPCIRCGLCSDACPVRLLPQQLLAFSRTLNNEALLEHNLFDCIECGACDYVCPSHIPLVSIYQNSKSNIGARKQDFEQSEGWKQRFQQHQIRLKKDKDEALTKKADTKKANKEVSPEMAQADPSSAYISKEQASRDIAAAVARVQAKRKNDTGKNTKQPSKPDELD